MGNLRENILFKVPKICKDEGVDSRVFDARAAPHEDSLEMKMAKKEIRERYLDLLSRIPFHIVEDFYDHNRGYSKEKVGKVKRAIEISFEGAFRNLLKEIKDMYPEIAGNSKEKGRKGEKDGPK